MTSRWGDLKQRAGSVFAETRRRWSWLDQPLAAYQHYSAINGNALAAASTYFGFLSFYPLLAIAFYVVGRVAVVFPQAEENLVKALNAFLPGIFGEGEGQIPITVFTDNATTVGLIGLVGALYAGLGWLSGVRQALEVTFDEPREERYGFLGGKIRDLLALGVLGVTLMASIALSGVIGALTSDAAAGLNLGDGVLRVLLDLLAHAVAIAVTTVLFLLMYTLLTKARLSMRARLYGALVGAVLFELLKLLAFWVLGAVREQEAFALLGLSLVLLVWINYFSRILVFSGAWTFTTGQRALARL